MSEDLDKDWQEDLAFRSEKPRCTDCDADCWHVPNKVKCWLGIPTMEIAKGYCPWLLDGLEFPPLP